MSLFKNKNITEEEFAQLFEEFYFLREAEIDEKEALAIIAEEQTKKSIITFLTSLQNKPSFIEGLMLFPQLAPDYIIALLKQGQKNNEEIKVLKSISTHLTQLLFLDSEGGSYKKKLKQRLTYPIATLVVAFMISTILLVFAVPVFDDLFAGFGAELPAFTLCVINISEFMQQWWWVCIAILWFAVFSFMHPLNLALRSRLALYFSVTLYAEISMITRTLHLLLSYDFNLQKSLELSASVSKNTIIHQAILHCSKTVSSGNSFVDYLKNQHLFPNSILQPLRVFEKTKHLNILQSLANKTSFKLKNKLNFSAKLLSIILMIIIGILVGGFIIAMYLPIFAMGDAVG